MVAALPDLIKIALAARPELRAAELAMEAAGARAKWERSKIFSLISVIDMNGEGKQGFEIGPGLQVELPLFHRNKGGITRAEAELERAARQYAAVRQRIVMEVQESHTQLLQAREALQLWRARFGLERRHHRADQRRHSTGQRRARSGDDRRRAAGRDYQSIHGLDSRAGLRRRVE